MPAIFPGNKNKRSELAVLLGRLLDSRSLPVENDALKKKIPLYLSTPLISKKDLDSFDLLVENTPRSIFTSFCGGS